MLAVRALLVVFGLAWAFVAHAEPSFPTLNGRVVDAAGVLDQATLTALTAQLEEHEASTTNQIVVATVPSLEGYDIADYGIQLARHWEIGTAEKNNGVVLLVAPKERKVRIEVGYGLEGALPDGLAGDIIRKRILPSFRENDYPGGINKGVDSIIEAIAGEYPYDPTQTSSEESPAFHAVVPIIFISLMFFSNLVRSRFNNRRVSQAIIPAGFAGMVGLIVSNNPIIAIAVGLGAFALIYLITKNARSSSGSSANRTGTGYGGGFGGGGGFSGGGGGFGGGGASGGW